VNNGIRCPHAITFCRLVTMLKPRAVVRESKVHKAEVLRMPLAELAP